HPAGPAAGVAPRGPLARRLLPGTRVGAAPAAMGSGYREGPIAAEAATGRYLGSVTQTGSAPQDSSRTTPQTRPSAAPPSTSGRLCRARRSRDQPSSGSNASAATPAPGHRASSVTPANARLAMCSESLIQRLATAATHSIATTASTPLELADPRPPCHHQ